MISLKQSFEIYLEKFPYQTINSVLDIGNEWVISGKDMETGSTMLISPIAISKETGEMRVFFPPENIEKLKNAINVEF